MYKAKVNQTELNRYENLFNTAYVVSQNILPFTDYTYQWSSFGQWSFMQGYLCKGTCINFIKTISEVLRNHTIGHNASSIISIVYRLLCHWSRGNTFKKSPPWHSWTNNCACRYRMYKKNRISNFFQITCPGISTTFPYFHTPVFSSISLRICLISYN